MQTKPNSRAKLTIALAALMIGALASESALAHGYRRGGGPRVSIGFYAGAPFAAYPFYRPYYRPYYYAPYYPPVVLAPPVYLTPPAPPVYVEQPQIQPQVIQPPVPQNYQQFAPQYQPEPQSYQPQPQPQQQQYQDAPQAANTWYYCAESQAYYPYVKQCAAGWQQVTPQPRAGN